MSTAHVHRAAGKLSFHMALRGREEEDKNLVLKKSLASKFLGKNRARSYSPAILTAARMWAYPISNPCSGGSLESS